MSELFLTPKHGDLIYDIGMHKGEDTEFYLLNGFRVVAIEANPELVYACRQRFRQFIDDGQLTIVEGAIVAGARGERVQFYKNAQSVWGTVNSDWAERNARLGAASTVIHVDAINLVDEIRKHGVPHYMKIDIEGADLACLDALKRFSERPDYVSLESDKTSLAGIKRELALLTELGYDAFQAVEQSAVPEMVPPFPAREGRYVPHRFEKGSSGLFGAELPDAWKSKGGILRQYRVIMWGYRLLGDDGVMKGWPKAVRSWTRTLLRRVTKAAVPGWYDTHARHSSVSRTAPSRR